MVRASARRSPSPRRDAVWTRLENVVIHDILTRAIGELRPTDGQPLRVLDIASGTGAGYAVLTENSGGRAPVTAGCQLSYLGLDVDPGVVAAARSAHPEAEFEVADIRESVPAGPFDLYLACSAASSRWKPEELHEVLTALFKKAARDRRRTVFVVEALGRYSIEWSSHWPETRWGCEVPLAEQDPLVERDSVVGRDSTADEQPMTFFDRRSLGAIIEAAADAAGIPAAVSFDDRCVLVGRHTDTGAFDPEIRPYRALLNELAEGVSPVRLGELLFEPPAADAPEWIVSFFEEWAREWNDLVRAFGEADTTVTGELAQRLASRLLDHERHRQRGLGAGHFLTATAVIDAS